MTKQENGSVQEILKRDKELKYNTDRHGAGSLLSHPSNINSSRLIMENHHIHHGVDIKNPEAPLLLTGMENVLGMQSELIKTAPSTYTVIKKFVKNAYNYILIGYSDELNEYHAWERKECFAHSEEYATQFNNEFMDSLEEGDTIEKGEMTRRPTTIDKYGNYCYGKNLNVVYTATANVYEDAIEVMNGAEDMLTATRTHKHTINLNDNDILINWYGNDKTYQGVPYVGEKTKKGVLCIIRRIDHSKSPFSLKRKHLSRAQEGDTTIYGHGRVIDVDIRFNKTRDKLVDVGANRVINTMFDEQQEFYREVYDYMNEIAEVKIHENDATYSAEFSRILDNVYDYIDAEAYFVDSNDEVYGNMQVVITTFWEEPLAVGSKLVGRTANKGVVAKIHGPEGSWHMEDGTPIHLLVSSLGVVGRLNPAQLNEHHINGLSESARRMVDETDDLEEKGDIIYRLYKGLHEGQAKSFKKYYAKLSDKEKKRFCKRIVKTGIQVVQEPLDNKNLVEIAEMNDEFPLNYGKMVNSEGKKTINKVECAPMFFIRLMQDPTNKYAVRSKGPITPTTGLLIKSGNKKKGISPYSDTPTRFGESELEVLLCMVNHPAAIATWMAEHSTSFEAKKRIAEDKYLDYVSTISVDDYEHDSDEDLREATHMLTLIESGTPSPRKNVEAIFAYFSVLGVYVKFTRIKAPKGEYFSDDIEYFDERRKYEALAA